MVRFIRYIILIALLQAVAGIFLSHAQSFTSASGIVKDSITGEPLPFVSVYFDGSTIGAMTDDNGTFTLQNNQGYTKLAAASLGYDTKFIDLKPGKKNDNLEVLLKPTAFEISEVVVKPKREKYTRKDNPAVELIKKVIAHKNDNRIEAKPEYQTEVYENPPLMRRMANIHIPINSKNGAIFQNNAPKYATIVKARLQFFYIVIRVINRGNF